MLDDLKLYIEQQKLLRRSVIDGLYRDSVNLTKDEIEQRAKAANELAHNIRRLNRAVKIIKALDNQFGEGALLTVEYAFNVLKG